MVGMTSLQSEGDSQVIINTKLAQNKQTPITTIRIYRIFFILIHIEERFDKHIRLYQRFKKNVLVCCQNKKQIVIYFHACISKEKNHVYIYKII
jgi:intergrase/recombinase